MIAIAVLHFFFLLMIVGGSIRFVEFKWPNNAIVQAIGVIY